MQVARVPAPSLIWVRGRWSGDMMIDGVPDVSGSPTKVRPLNLSGKLTPQRGGDRNLKGADRRHQLIYGQGTCAMHDQATTSWRSGTGSVKAASPSSRRL